MKKPDFKYAWDDLRDAYAVSIKSIRNLTPGWWLELVLLWMVTVLFPIVFLLDAFLGPGGPVGSARSSEKPNDK